jgi:acyl dehydratase
MAQQRSRHVADKVYLEDLAVGQTFTHGPVELTAADIKAFARQFDPQQFHLDEAAAEASLFGRLAASGWHTAALTMRLLVTGGPRFGWGSIGAGAEITWPRPAYAGDVLTLHGEVIEITPSRSKPDRGIVRVRLLMKNQRGEVVQELIPRVLVPRRPASRG